MDGRGDDPSVGHGSIGADRVGDGRTSGIPTMRRGSGRVTVGEECPIEDIYVHHMSAVHGLARRLVGDASAADVSQAVFLTFWRHRDRYDPTHGSPRGLLLAMTRHLSIDHLRSQSRRDVREERYGRAAERVDGHGSEEWGDLTHVVSRALAALSPAERLVIETTYFGDVTYREAAVVLNIAEGTVKSRIRSGLRKMHHQLVSSGHIHSGSGRRRGAQALGSRTSSMAG